MGERPKLWCRIFGHKFWRDRWNGAVIKTTCERCGAVHSFIVARDADAAARKREGE